MSPRPSARRPLTRLVPALLGLLLCGGLGLPRSAGADPDALEGIRKRLVHPLEAVREAAERDLVEQGEAGRAVTAELARARDPALRLAAWHALRHRPAWLDAACCRAALRDEDARVGVAAARALLACAAQASQRSEALLPAGALCPPDAEAAHPAAVRALGIALADELERAPAERVPSIGLALGEGVVPALVAIAAEDRHHNRIRSLAVTVLGRIGGARASRALIDLVPRSVLRDRTALFGALMDLRLDEEARRTLYTHLHTIDDGRGLRSTVRWRLFFRGRGAWGGWAERGRLRRLIAVHPPVEDADALRSYYERRLESQRRHPSETIDIVHGLIALGGIEADDVTTIVDGAFETLWHPRWRSRAEELGGIVVALHGLRDHRATLREALRELFDLHAADSAEEFAGLWDTTLPRSVEAWGHYVLGTRRERVESMATALICGEGEVPIWSARRLGARLWTRLGQPPADLVRASLVDGDAWMRRQGLAWLGALPEAEREAALTRLAGDEDDAVFLAALDLIPGRLTRDRARRLLRLASEGSRGERMRAWRRLARAAPEALAGDPARDPDPALDARLARLARYRAALGLDEDLPAAANR